MRNYEAFSMRDGEIATILEHQPDNGRWFAVMMSPVPPMPGPMQAHREIDGLTVEPVELAAVIACQKRRDTGEFVWMQLSPLTKEVIGDVLFNSRAEKGRWYYALITD